MPDASEIPGQGILADFGGPTGFMNLLNGLFGTSTDINSTTNSPEASDAANQIFQLLLPSLTSDDFSPGKATADAQGQVQQIIQQMTESTSAGVPAITSGEAMSGGYGGTAAGLMKNDLAARIATAGAAQVAQTKTSYAAARSTQVAGIVALINAMANAHKVSSQNTTNNGQVTNPNTQRAAAAAALASLLKGGAKPSAPQKPNNSAGQGTKAPDSGPYKATENTNDSNVGKDDPNDSDSSIRSIGEQVPNTYNNPSDETGGGQLDMSNPFASQSGVDDAANPDLAGTGVQPDSASPDASSGLDLSSLSDFSPTGDLSDLSNLGDITDLLNSLSNTDTSGGDNNNTDNQDNTDNTDNSDNSDFSFGDLFGGDDGAGFSFFDDGGS